MKREFCDMSIPNHYHKTAVDVPLANNCTFLSLSLYCALFTAGEVDLVAVPSLPPPPGSRHSTVSYRGGGGMESYHDTYLVWCKWPVFRLNLEGACHIESWGGPGNSKSYISMDILWVTSRQSLNVKWEVAGMEKVLSQQLLWLITISSLTVNHGH